MYYALIVVILLQQLSLICCQRYLPFVPCPKIFKYVIDGRRSIAEITLPTPDVHKVTLDLSFTVPGTTEYDIGDLTLNNKNGVDDIKNNRPFIYTFTLIDPRNIPRITEIKYNGNIVCVGPKPDNRQAYINFDTSHTFGWSDSSIELPSRPIKELPEQETLINDINLSKPVTNPFTNLLNRYQNNNICGEIRNKRQTDARPIPLIIKGTEVSRHDHPWLVALFSVQRHSFTFFCGGNLISNKHILTAAHCVKFDSNPWVRIGAHDNMEFNENGVKYRRVSKYITHNEYRPQTGHADIAILHLSEEVQFSEYVKPICLWNDEVNLDNIVGDIGTIMGWGETEFGDTSPTPLQTHVTIVSQEQCQSDEGLKPTLSDTTFCAGRIGTGPCSGDSGGSLLLKRQGRWYIRGIVSLSLSNPNGKGCDVNKYAVYVDTAKYMGWIISNME